ncbi:metallophosphoesterase [Oceanobacillus salinisoli]|uniref:metallophosphoesterase n=1 Tax=Oceanobacillus salinisoli TaxID=2678611 RepID=UPI0012E29E75|nr:metallophosphoesterase [Oceanobacillus salinisoli]
MYEVLILSDSHGLTDKITEIKKRHQIKTIIHCGDSELDFESKPLDGMYKVAGNCDFDSRYPNEEVITVGELTFFVTHGHLYHVKSNVMSLSYRAEEVGANVICFGHTHIAGAEQVDQQLFVNPGSIRLPRNRREKTYAIMKWESINDVHVNFYSVDGEEVRELAYHGSF